MPLIDLSPCNKIIDTLLRDRLSGNYGSVTSRFADFDGVLYLAQAEKHSPVLQINMRLKCFPDLLAYGAEGVMKREYGSFYSTNVTDTYNVTLNIDVSQVLEKRDAVEDFITKVSMLKRMAFAAPFEVAFDAQRQGKESELMTVKYREKEAIYIRGHPDRVTVIFSTTFDDAADCIIGRTFLQEFVDARRQSNLQTAPQVLFSVKDIPLELRSHVPLTVSDSISYVTFVLFPRHFSSDAASNICISRIQLFRDYLHYHIKASKAYMHSRMRTRTDSFIKILNRAKVETHDKERKLASGRTFKAS